MSLRRIEAIVNRWLKKSQDSWLLETLVEDEYVEEDVANFLRENTPEQIGERFGDEVLATYESIRGGSIAEKDIIVFIDGDDKILGKINSIEFETETETGTFRVDVSVDALGRSGDETKEKFSILADEEAEDRKLFKIDEEKFLQGILGE